MIGQMDQAKKSIYNYHQILKQFGFLPELYDVSNGETKRSGYPLRPEFVESLFYLHRATHDPHLLVMAAEVINAIETSSRTECGYSTVKSVNTHLLEDRMESFFLAETLKYLYLLFAPEDHFFLNSGESGVVFNSSGSECILQAGGYIFNTEAHPVDVSALDCCLSQRRTRREEPEGNINDRDKHSQPLKSMEEYHDFSYQTENICVSREIDRFHYILYGHPSEDDSKIGFWKEFHPNSCFSQDQTKFHPKDCDFDLLSCPVESFASRLSRYGQMLS